MNQENNSNTLNTGVPNSQPKKKKLKWWIPVLILLLGVLMCVISIMVEMKIRTQNELILDYQITNYPSIMIFRWLAIICWLMVIPSLIMVIVK